MGNNQFATLEDAQAEIVRLNDQLTEITNERDTLYQNNATLTEDNNRLRTLNQNYFNRLSQQFASAEDEKHDDEKEIPSCVDLANTINL